MSSIQLRNFGSREYFSPREVLVGLRRTEIEIASIELPDNLRTLRTKKLKPLRELREAALFCYGMEQRTGVPIFFSPKEFQDYDFVAVWAIEDCELYAPVQIKEVVPEHINPDVSIQKIIDDLSKYSDSKELIIAIHLNRQMRFDSQSLRVSNLGIRGLWVFGATSPDQGSWGLWGDFIAEPMHTSFTYPDA